MILINSLNICFGYPDHDHIPTPPPFHNLSMTFENKENLNKLIKWIDHTDQNDSNVRKITLIIYEIKQSFQDKDSNGNLDQFVSHIEKIIDIINNIIITNDFVNICLNKEELLSVTQDLKNFIANLTKEKWINLLKVHNKYY